MTKEEIIYEVKKTLHVLGVDREDREVLATSILANLLKKMETENE